MDPKPKWIRLISLGNNKQAGTRRSGTSRSFPFRSVFQIEELNKNCFLLPFFSGTVAVYRRSDRHCVVADLRRRELLQTTADGSGSNVTMFLMETRRTSWRQQKNLLGF